jgi:multidrug efflux pump subunit AcrA (membrane-fusion protein)
VSLSPNPVPDPPRARATSERAGVTVLDQALWRDLLQTGDDTAFAAAWLGLTCRSIPGAISGALLLTDAGGGLSLSTTWPEGVGLSPSLAAAAKAAAEAGRGVVQPPAEGTATSLALPIQLDNALSGVAAIDVTLAPPSHDPRAAMRQLQWAAAWVRERLRAAEAHRSADQSARMELAVDLLAAALEPRGAAASVRVTTTELAAKLDCERVSIGFLRGGRSRLAGVSHSAAFGERMTLTRAIEDAMDEAIDQFALVLTPPPDDAVLVTRAHAHLAAMHTPATVLTVPLLARDKPIGAMTLERPLDRPFTTRDVALAEAVAAILGPALADKRDADRWLVPHAIASARDYIASLVGPAHLSRKLWLMAVTALVLAAWFVRADYTVHAHARIAGTVQRAIAAPFDGFIREAPVRAGDEIRPGALIVALDDRDLVLERLRWVTERQVHISEYDQALSAAKRADAVRVQSQIAQADAQIRLADEQLARTRLTAPFDGLVVSGDLSQSIGAPVRRGDVLFEVAPLDDYRVELQVPESQIADIVPGQQGTLVVGALPDEALPLAIQRVTPVADAKDGAMTFRADGQLLAHSARLRPGMEGIAKIEVGRARLVWIWTRSFQHWLRLNTWSWLP